MLGVLRAEQIGRVSQLCAAYREAVRSAAGTPQERTYRDTVRARRAVTRNILRPALHAYVGNVSTLDDFMHELDKGLRSRRLWGMTGLRIRIILIALANALAHRRDHERIVRWALAPPRDSAGLAARIRRMHAVLTPAGGLAHERAELDAGANPALLFLSFAWHIQQPDRWPLFQASTLAALTEAGLWRPGADTQADFIGFCDTMAAVTELCVRELPEFPADYLVEQVLTIGDRDTGRGSEIAASNGTIRRAGDEAMPGFVPPIVALAPDLAEGRVDPRHLAYLPGTSAERGFEMVVHAAFTVMGYKSVLLGQGKGRVPDGVALCRPHDYVILWDAKIRQGSYRMGTDDRVIRDYVVSQAERLRADGVHNIYYAIVSSQFANWPEREIETLKLETNLSEICMLEAAALVAMVERHLQAPRRVTLGPAGLQRIFGTSGIITPAIVGRRLAARSSAANRPGDCYSANSP